MKHKNLHSNRDAILLATTSIKGSANQKIISILYTVLEPTWKCAPWGIPMYVLMTSTYGISLQ